MIGKTLYVLVRVGLPSVGYRNDPARIYDNTFSNWVDN